LSDCPDDEPAKTAHGVRQMHEPTHAPAPILLGRESAAGSVRVIETAFGTLASAEGLRVHIWAPIATTATAMRRNAQRTCAPPPMAARAQPRTAIETTRSAA
jgi:hypothetical protein